MGEKGNQEVASTSIPVYYLNIKCGIKSDPVGVIKPNARWQLLQEENRIRELNCIYLFFESTCLAEFSLGQGLD